MEKPKGPSDEGEVDVIYSPYEGEGQKKSSAILSVALEDLTNCTVCFAFMEDGLAYVDQHADIATFWQTFASFSFGGPENVNLNITFEEGSFAPFQWVRTCFTIDLVNGSCTLVVNGNETSRGTIKFTEKIPSLNMALHKTNMGIRVTGFNIFSSALSTDLMGNITKAESVECGKPGDHLSWEKAFKQWNLKGQARNGSAFGPCQRESSIAVFSDDAKFPSATACMKFCQKLGGRSPPVRTIKEWENLTKELDPLSL